MRTTFALAAAVLVLASPLAARPLDVHVGEGRLADPHAGSVYGQGEGRHHVYRGNRHGRRVAVGPARLTNYLVFHGLLTPEQAACSTLVRGPFGSARVEHLGVFQTYGGRCPGVPQPPTHLFDVYVDTVSGVVDTTRDNADELKTVL